MINVPVLKQANLLNVEHSTLKESNTMLSNNQNQTGDVWL